MAAPTGQIFASAGTVTVGVAGASVAATNTAAIIVATGGAVAVAAVGFGVYYWMKNRRAISSDGVGEIEKYDGDSD